MSYNDLGIEPKLEPSDDYYYDPSATSLGRQELIDQLAKIRRLTYELQDAQDALLEHIDNYVYEDDYVHMYNEYDNYTRELQNVINLVEGN